MYPKNDSSIRLTLRLSKRAQLNIACSEIRQMIAQKPVGVISIVNLGEKQGRKLGRCQRGSVPQWDEERKALFSFLPQHSSSTCPELFI